MNHQLKFEQLPNEIFYEIFEYLDLDSVHFTFTKLNSRFDSLLKCFNRIRINLFSLGDIDLPVHTYFLPYCATMAIYHEDSFYNEMKDIVFPIRSLILYQATRRQWNSIKPLNFPNLERLHIMNSAFSYRTEELCSLIFSNQFQHLYYCSLPHIPYHTNNNWTSSNAMRSLDINIWDIRVCVQILNACPNLIHLYIKLNREQIDEQILSLNACTQHLNLQRLRVHCQNSVKYQMIDSILSLVPNLRYFSLNTNFQRLRLIPLNKLASILEIRTPNLNRLSIKMYFFDNYYLDEQIHKYHKLFQSCATYFLLENVQKKLIITGSSQET